MAVAFWGRGAETLLSGNTGTFHVICNLHAGGTNPAVIRTIKSIPHVVVRQLDSLHAKVVAADCGAVISSANISTNGLGYDGPDTFTWHEAGVRVPSDSPEFQGILVWLQMLWGQARPITEKDLIAAEAAWARRKHTQCRSNKDNEEAGPQEDQKPTLVLKAVHFPGRIKPDQRNIRSAAALLALDGHQGRAMPLTAFAFLFLEDILNGLLIITRTNSISTTTKYR
ncbi:phospholipase D family protein [Cupriavidus consociatus]|uniref:phospholipase D family protein n=1 Tax=Cupriavidus consociatus TaxID=2821357 RepID=UPI001AEA0B66|nr:MULTISPECIES: phospholipase D family protein [unclassified Cupriavidus]MBP0625411.1 phospholipase D family protein [Cupriavidus sp. LEh25]MDK2662152.1 phospholipase D family protein [Cupriavidus sp. LEh21]